MADLPKILLVSEVTLATTRAGAAANPTLYNLFSGYPSERILSLIPQTAAAAHPPQSPFDRNVVTYPDLTIPRPRRGRRFVDPLLNTLDFQLQELRVPRALNQISAFQPDVVVVSPIGVPALLIGAKLRRLLKKPVVAYFMDDWPAIDRRRWLTGGVRKRVRQILEDSSAWLMISEELRDVMSVRYGVVQRPTLIVHNPVDPVEFGPPAVTSRRNGTFRVLYTGSVQPMHADALIAVAQAVHALREAGRDVELVVHTSPAFERAYQEEWRRWGVRLGGLVPYSELPEVLRNGDLLLVALSFRREWAHMAMYSLLTKITDYMATGVPLCVCGPPGSASINFVRRWKCGLACESNEQPQIVAALDHCLQRPPEHVELARRAYHCLTSTFAVDPVQKRLYDFLTDVAAGRVPLP